MVIYRFACGVCDGEQRRWNMIISELRKLWKKNSFLLLLAFLLVCNVGLQILQDRKESVPTTAYHAFDKKLKSMSEQEKEAYVQGYYERVKGLCLVEQIQNMQAMKSEWLAREIQQLLSENKGVYQKYYEEWKQGDYLVYGTTLDEEEVFAEDVYQRFQKLKQYDDYLDEVCRRAETQSEISIFANTKDSGKEEGKPSFAVASAERTAKKYEVLRNRDMTFFSYEWVNRMQDTGTSEIVLLLLLFVVVWQMFYEEKKKGLFLIMRTMPGGRLKLCTAKMIALIFNTVLVSLLLYGTVALYYMFWLGIPDFSASIQSVAACQSCPYPITVGEYIVLFIGVRMLAVLAFAMLLFLVEILAKHIFWMFLIGLGALGTGALLYYLVSPVAKGNIMHYSNFYSWFLAKELFVDYRHLKLLGHPVDTMSVVLVEMIIFIAMITVTAIFCFCRKRNHKNHPVFVNALLKKRKKQKTHTILWRYELSKILFIYRGSAIIAVFLLLMVFQMVTFDCYQTPNELRYRWQMQEYKGRLTREKQIKILKQKQEYENIRKAIREVKICRAKGEITKEEAESQEMMYESKLAFLPAFERLYQRYAYILKHPEAQFVYEEGYQRVFGNKDRGHFSLFLFLNVVLILMLAPVLTADADRGMNPLLCSTKRGREEREDTCFFVSGALVTILYLFLLINVFYQGISGYGLPGCFAPITSLAGYEQFPSWLPIIVVVIGYVLLQWFFLMILTAFLLWFSKKIGNTLHAMIWELIIFVIPGVLFSVLSY